MTTATYKCKCCGSPFEARTADRARGWARFCSKSCKAVKQSRSPKRYPRHDGKSPMKYRKCDTCGEAAVNGVYGLGGEIEWFCEAHRYDATEHPFSSDVLGQWFPA